MTKRCSTRSRKTGWRKRSYSIRKLGEYWKSKLDKERLLPPLTTQDILAFAPPGVKEWCAERGIA